MLNLALANLQKQAEKEKADAEALALAMVWDVPYRQAFRAFLDATIALFNLECEDRSAGRDVDATKWAEPLAIAGKSIRENEWIDLFQKRYEQGGSDEFLYSLLIEASKLDIDALRTCLESINQSHGKTVNRFTWQHICNSEWGDLNTRLYLERRRRFPDVPWPVPRYFDQRQATPETAPPVPAGEPATAANVGTTPEGDKPPADPQQPPNSPPGWHELGDAKRAILTVLTSATEPLENPNIAKKAGYTDGTLRHHYVALQDWNYIAKAKGGYKITPIGAALVQCERL